MDEVTDAETCDDIHDEDAPTHYLCTRCFPDLNDRAVKGDLFQLESDYDEVQRDEQREVE